MVNFPFLNNKSPNAQAPRTVNNPSAEKVARQQRYKKAWQAYFADLPDPLVIQEANDNVKVNPIRSAIEVGVFFLFGDEVRFEVSPNRSTELGLPDTKPGETASQPSKANAPEPAPTYLADLNRAWKANSKESWLRQVGVSGGIHGDVFVKFIPNGAGIKNDLPRLQYLDPANVDVITDEDDYTKVLKFLIEYITEKQDGTRVTRTQEITPDYEALEGGEDDFDTPDPIPVSWTIQNYEQEWNYDMGAGYYPGPGGRKAVGPPKKWPYSWPPIEHCSNIEVPHMYWGLPDVDESTVEVVESLQRQMSTLAKIVRIHGSPRMYAKGIMPELAGEIDVSPDNIITLPAGAGVDSDLKIIEGLGNVASLLDVVKELRKQLFEQIQVPPIAMGDISNMGSSMGGISMSILYAPIVQKTDLKRISYGNMLDRLNRKMLILMGHEDADTYDDLTVVWPESMPGSAYLERQTLMEDQKLGLSNQTAMTRLGYDWEREFKQTMEEKTAILEMESKYLAMQAGAVSVTGKDGSVQAGHPSPKIGGKLDAGEDSGSKDPRGGNNNPSGKGNSGGSMGATGNSTPKNKDNPSTSRSRGGPNRG